MRVVKSGIVSVIDEGCKSDEEIYIRYCFGDDIDMNVCDDGAIYYTGDDENVYDTKKISRGCCC